MYPLLHNAYVEWRYALKEISDAEAHLHEVSLLTQYIEDFWEFQWRMLCIREAKQRLALAQDWGSRAYARYVKLDGVWLSRKIQNSQLTK